MELTETLLGKYGSESDKLIFKILPRGEKLKNFLRIIRDLKTIDSKVTEETINPEVLDLYAGNFTAEEALRYDLTVPFARYVVQHRNEITFPFKRFQIQSVWRADRPQKGRYREFYQCDADVIGSNSLLNEIELIQIIDKVFTQLGISIIIKINNRKILHGLAEATGELDKIIDLTIAIDKIEKIGIEKVKEELKSKGFSDNAVVWIEQIINRKKSSKEMLDVLTNYLHASKIGQKGILEMREIFEKISDLSLQTALEFDISLARGLNYYTGAIIEVKANGVQIGSVSGGGRYDDLTGIFGLPNVSGVGISFGVDRIYDVMEELKLFETLQTEQASTQILFVNFGEKEELYCLKLVTELRNADVAAELYPDRDKIKKQMSYANDRKIPFVALVGEQEMQSGKIKLKDMLSGEEKLVSKEQIHEMIVSK